MKKSIVLHSVFWIVYLILGIILHLTWMKSGLHNIPEKEQVWIAIKTGTLLLLPNAILIYYLLFVGRKKLLLEIKFMFIIQICLGISLDVAFFCIFFYYYIYPEINGISPEKQALFSTQSAFVSGLELEFVTLFAIALKSLRVQIENKAKEKNLVKKNLETELKFLRNQINPHFLLNTLNNIYALARKKSDDTEEVVMKLSELLRFILYESSDNFILINKEIKVVEDYLNLEMVRYNKKLTITFKKDIDNNFYEIRPLFLLSLVENAFKHGISESRFESFIYLELKINEGKLDFVIENPLVDHPLKSTLPGIGLANMRRQLELTYNEHALIVEDKNKIFKISLHINLNNHVKI